MVISVTAQMLKRVGLCNNDKTRILKKELFTSLRLTVGLNEKSAENEQMENKIRYSQRVEDERLKQIYQEMEDQLQIDREAIRRFLYALPKNKKFQMATQTNNFKSLILLCTTEKRS